MHPSSRNLIGRTLVPCGALLLSLLIASCGGGGGGGTAGEGGGQPSVVTNQASIPPGETCPNGGISVETGIDENGNGTLDPEEVDSTQTVCNGSAGPAGPAGDQSLVVVSEEPPGSNCPAGGAKVESGIDPDGDGDLDEVLSTIFVCGTLNPGTLIAADRFGDIFTLNAETGAAYPYLDTWSGSCGECFIPSIGVVSSMAYDPLLRRLYAGMGGNSNISSGDVYAIDLFSGQAMSWATLNDSPIAGMALRLDGSLFTFSGNQYLERVDSTGTPTSIDYACCGTNSGGNGLAFDSAGLKLYAADYAGLHLLDQNTADVLKTVPIEYQGMDGVFDLRVNSMTVDSRDGRVFAIVLGWDDSESKRVFLATVDLASGVVASVGEIGADLDGLAFLPLSLSTTVIANAGADQTLTTFDPVTLDGTGSYDSGGGALEYSWALLEAPAGSMVTTSSLSDPASDVPAFTPDAHGAYVWRLTVTNPAGAADSDVVAISIPMAIGALSGPVAVFTDNAPWGVTATIDSLLGFGVTVVQYDSTGMGIVDLSGYAKVITVADQPMAYYQAIAGNSAWFEAYVSGGGVLQMNLADQTDQHTDGLVFPGGLSIAHQEVAYGYFADPSHPTLLGPWVLDADASFGHSSMSHDYLGILPEGAAVIMREADTDQPTAVEIRLGEGVIYANTLTIEWTGTPGSPAAPAVDNFALFGLWAVPKP